MKPRAVRYSARDCFVAANLVLLIVLWQSLCSCSRSGSTTTAQTNCLGDALTVARISNALIVLKTNGVTLTPEQLQEMTNDPMLRNWLGAPTADEVLRDFAKRARTTLGIPPTLRWASVFAEENPQAPHLIATGIPESIVNLEPGVRPYARVEKDLDGSSAVFLIWGGGWQRKGLIFTTNESLLKRVWIHTEAVTNGVFAFISVEPTVQP